MAIALGAYALAIPSGFVFDDSVAIEANPLLTGEAPWYEAFSRDFWGRPAEISVRTYRPLPVLGFILDRHLGGGAAWFFHLVNVLLHGAVVVVLYRVWRTLVKERVAFAAAALFAVLSPPSEAVQSIVGRADLLAALFGLLGLAAHLRPGASSAAVASLCFLLGLFSKESAVAFPAVWLLVEWWRKGWWRGPELRALMGRLAAYAGMVAIYFGFRAHALGDAFATRVGDLSNPLVLGTTLERVLGAGETFWARYLRAIIDPGWHLYLCSAPACGPRDATSLTGWLGVVAVLALVITALLCRRRAPLVTVSLGWFLLLFLPISNFLVVSPALYAERLLYAPLMGIVVLAAAGADALAHRIRPRIAWGLFAALALTHASALQTRHQEWRSDASLFLSALEVEPDSGIVQANAASVLMDLGEIEAALEHSQRSVELEPANASAWMTRAMALDLLDRTDEARAAWQQAISRSRAVDVSLNYAIFLANQDELDRALAILREHPFRHHGGEAWKELEVNLAKDIAEREAAAGSRGVRDGREIDLEAQREVEDAYPDSGIESPTREADQGSSAGIPIRN